MNFDNMLRKKNVRKGQILYEPLYMETQKVGRFKNTGIRTVVARGWGRGNGSQSLMGTVLLGEDEKVLEMNSDYGFTAM